MSGEPASEVVAGGFIEAIPDRAVVRPGRETDSTFGEGRIGFEHGAELDEAFMFGWCR